MDFSTIYQEYHPRIHRYLTHLSGETEAVDLTQTVFLKVSRSLDGFRGDSSLSTWIYRIATNSALDHASSSLARQKESEQQLDDDASLDDFPDSGAQGADHEYIRREMTACIRGVVDQLPKNYRTVLLLSEFEEITNAEISAILGITLDTVKIRLHRARTALRNAMESHCSFYHDERSELMCDRKSK
ncbi:MAG: sigma-70 family RNA polymerase sigma factor [Desulfuromonadaceae bacterium]|nr:sigma-70 family RNA polymerase sigma factor [Desulfuromonadaceae bacterium]